MDVTVYLDFDGVLVTKFSQGAAFDVVCVNVLREFFALCKTQSHVLHLCIISDWRFEMSQEELTEQLKKHQLLEQVDTLTIPIQFQNREQQILHRPKDWPFIILDDATYAHPELRAHHIQLRTEDGLRGIDNVTHLLKFF